MSEGRAVVDAVEARGIAFSWGATRRYMAAYREARSIAEGLGAPRQILVKFGRAPLMWTHPHSIDIASFFARDADIVSARAVFAEPHALSGHVLDADPRIDLAQLTFSNGLSAIITAADGCDVVVACADGEVAVRSDGATIGVRRRAGAYFAEETCITPHPTESGLQGVLGTLRDLARGARAEPGVIGARRALALQNALFAMALSGCEGGRDILCGDVPDDFVVTGRSGDRFA
jgi:predicted dehydrogenase